MKKLLFTLTIILNFQILINAQIDRTQPPTPLTEKSISLGKLDEFSLPNGLKVIVVENHKLPTVRVYLNLDIPPVKQGKKAGYLSIFGDMLRAGTKNYTKELLDEEIDYLGTDVYTDAKFLGISTLKKELEPSMKIMKELLLNPTFSNQTELDKQKKQLKTSLSSLDKNSDAISNRVSNVILYGKDDPWGEYETENSIDNITLEDFKNYYNTYFKPNISYLTIVGDINKEEAKNLANTYFSDWISEPIESDIPLLHKNINGIKIAFVDLPSATQSNISIMGLANLKKHDLEYFPSILGNNILGYSSSGRLYKIIREKYGWTYNTYSSIYDSYRRLGNFKAFAKVRNAVTDSTVIEMMKIINEACNIPPSLEELNLSKAKYNGIFSLSLENPETAARFIRTQLIENLNSDFYKNYLKKINAVSADEIPNALNKIIDPQNLTLLIVGKGDEILPKLKKIGYPIVYYDKFGNLLPKDNNDINKDLENVKSTNKIHDIKLYKVLNKYFIATAGSKEKMRTIHSIITEAKMYIPQLTTPVEVTYKFLNPNKQVAIMSIQGQIIKQGFDGTKGYSTIRPISDKETVEYKNRKGYFPELYYDGTVATLEGIHKIDDQDAYKISITDGSKLLKNIYFSVNTGLKLKEETSPDFGSAITSFSEYKNFDGYNLPTKITTISNNEKLSQEISNYIINPPLTDKDFKP